MAGKHSTRFIMPCIASMSSNFDTTKHVKRCLSDEHCFNPSSAFLRWLGKIDLCGGSQSSPIHLVNMVICHVKTDRHAVASSLAMFACGTRSLLVGVNGCLSVSTGEFSGYGQLPKFDLSKATDHEMNIPQACLLIRGTSSHTIAVSGLRRPLCCRCY